MKKEPKLCLATKTFYRNGKLIRKDDVYYLCENTYKQLCNNDKSMIEVNEITASYKKFYSETFKKLIENWERIEKPFFKINEALPENELVIITGMSGDFYTGRNSSSVKFASPNNWWGKTDLTGSERIFIKSACRDLTQEEFDDYINDLERDERHKKYYWNPGTYMVRENEKCLCTFYENWRDGWKILE